ncbi:hypothetical protein HDK77DRAFT_448347 [Phyllosticta capitalensis]|uniref:Secreted protein n=1 Tax=Phyllosticta capitalensis TaxID=121624 RepID=A0ABR1YFT2_9PEZI
MVWFVWFSCFFGTHEMDAELTSTSKILDGHDSTNTLDTDRRIIGCLDGQSYHTTRAPPPPSSRAQHRLLSWLSVEHVWVGRPPACMAIYLTYHDSSVSQRIRCASSPRAAVRSLRVFSTVVDVAWGALEHGAPNQRVRVALRQHRGTVG